MPPNPNLFSNPLFMQQFFDNKPKETEMSKPSMMKADYSDPELRADKREGSVDIHKNDEDLSRHHHKKYKYSYSTENLVGTSSSSQIDEAQNNEPKDEIKIDDTNNDSEKRNDVDSQKDDNRPSIVAANTE